MIDLILIDPPAAPEKRFGKLAQAGSFLPSLGLAQLAAVAREKGFTAKIIDANIERYDLRDLVLAVMMEEKPTWVGISATTLTIDTAGKIAKLIKKVDKNVVVIVGGAHITALPEETLKKYTGIDIGVIGEGEETFQELLVNLKKGRGIERVKGLVIRKNSQTVMTGPRPFIADLDKLPFPAWDLLKGYPHRYYPSANSYLKLPAVHLVTSRGCTGQCTFCDRSVFGRRPRFFSAPRLMAMIDDLRKRYQIKEIQFFDDNFCLYPQRLVEICHGLAKRKISWSCQARADFLTQENLSLMKRSGCWQIGLGIESGSNKILKNLKKGETKEKMQEAVNLIHRNGIEIKGFFILGNPGETKKTLDETEKFILANPLTYVHTTYFTPYPGSEIYKSATKYGKFLCQKDDFTRLGRGVIDAVYIPNGLRKKDLEEKAARIFRKFYFRPQIIYYHLKKIIFSPRLWFSYIKGFRSVLAFANK